MEITTKELSIQGQSIKVHAISTGWVAVKQKFRESKLKGPLAILSFVLDRSFTEWMPIWVWVIEHPEGIFVIDTGENANVNDPDYFDASGRFAKWLNTTQFKFKVEREEEIDQQLLKIGLSVDQVAKVILTHMHIDHFDGLRHFPKTPILLHELEWKKPYGDLPKLYPDWFKPSLVKLDQSLDSFERVKFLTEGKDLALVHTPGHTTGHCSVLLKTDQGYLFFAGDVVYYQNQLVENKFCGGTLNYKAAKQTYESIKAFAKANDVVILPSHDGDAAKRLDGMQTFKVSKP